MVSYDPTWPTLFDSEVPALAAAFDPAPVTIEHVGSTAVPGLGAKPVIDIMVGVERLRDVESAIPAIEAIGYEYVPEYETQLPERRYFRKPRSGPRTHHLHVVARASAFWTRHLIFRDCLRANPRIAADYCELKRDLAERFPRDGIAYTEAKTPFIEAVMMRAGWVVKG